MNLNDIAYYVKDKVPSTQITLEQYITTDNLLPQKGGRVCAVSLPPNKCSLIHYQKGDVLVANIRPYLQKIWYADIEGGASPDVLVFRAKEGHNSQYVYTCLLQDAFFNFVMKAPIGAKMPRGEKNHILRFPIVPINNEEEVGEMISNLDRKIALNRAMNEELEQTARDLYDYWFLQFDFPDANGKPYRSSGGKMVYNDTLKREIPQGWEVKSVNDLCVSQRGVSFDKSNELSKGGILVLRGNNIENNHLVYDNNIVLIPNELISDAQRIRKYDIIMTMSSGSKEHIGKSMMFQSDSPHTYGAFLNKFMPQANCEHFIFDFFKSSYFKAKIKSICNGTGINNLTMKDFDDVLLPMPDYKTLIAYSNIAKAIYEQYGCNEESTNSLRSLRDELLPLLMNGQVKVKE